jgi:protein disulfide-isomerase A1
MKGSKVTLFKNFDEGKNNYDGEMAVEALESFVETNSIKTIMDFDQKAAEVIFSNAKDSIFALYSEVNDETTAFRKVLEEASNTLKGKVVMSESNVSEGLGSRLAEFLGYETNTKPAFCMISF